MSLSEVITRRVVVGATVNADVCASVRRRVSVSGCTNVADTVNAYVPPPTTSTSAAGERLPWRRPASPCQRVHVSDRLSARSRTARSSRNTYARLMSKRNG